MRFTTCGTIALIASLACVSVQAAGALTPNTLRAAPGEAAPATIDVMSWLQGTWRGSGLGGENEELWSAPHQGVMMGMYRLTKGGKAVFYEFLTISEVNGTLELRLKHFNPGLKGWEEKDDSVVFPFIAQRDGRIYFDGLTYEPRGDEVTIHLAIEDRKSGAVREETFRLQRAR